jgi:hypothetical protein
MNSRDERERKMLEDFPKGVIVRVIEPEGYISSVANKIRNRLGEVTGHQFPTPNPIVTFPAIGRRKEFRMVFAYRPHRELEIVTDAQAVAARRAAVDAKKEPAAKPLALEKKKA